MPIIKSAKKRVRVSSKATIRNSKTKRTIRESVKAFYKELETGKPTSVDAAHKKAVSAIDTAAKKNVIHKNKAARKKSQLSSAAKTAGVKPTPTTKAKKPAVKKVAPNKPVAKTKVAKKAPAKKPAAKK
ncbi:30S ribosomal protein S20 [Candidatus Saccharibacteria bacterium]|nr:30S ribosomal protein S20 [Candidatus Saccharibacteria bacterium]MDQ5885308.1 small subunit ribosomal protein [Patescibacteria group bacterium]MDQ5953565.1 small subunit ribosomal protein [Patescibacteria group bacterium]